MTKAVYEVVGNNTDGFWFTECKGLASTDRLIITTRPDGLPVRTVRIPMMSTNIDRATDIVTGVVRGDRTPSLIVTPCDAWTCDDGNGLTLAPDPNGSFSTATPIPVDGRDLLTLYAVRGDDEYQRVQTAPTLRVFLGHAGVSGTAQRPGAEVTVTVTRGARVATFKGTANRDGQFSGKLQRRSGTPFKLAAGDRVTSSIASDLDFVVPASATITGSAVSGTCFAGQQVVVSAVAPDKSFSGVTHLTAGGDGSFSIDLMDLILRTVTPGIIVSVECDPGEGDTVLIREVVP